MSCVLAWTGIQPASQKLAKYLPVIKKAMKTIMGWENTSQSVTVAYHRLGLALADIRSGSLWPQNQTWRKWCKSYEIDDTRRSRAKDIAHYLTEKQAEKMSLPDALRFVREQKHGEQVVAHAALSQSEQFLRKLDVIDAAIMELQTIGSKLTDDELVAYGDKLVEALLPLQQMRDLIEQKIGKKIKVSQMLARRQCHRGR